MRIAINAQLVSSERSFRNAGVSRYVRQLVEALSRIDSGNDYCVFVGRGVQPFVQHPGFRFIATSVDPQRPTQRILWEQIVLPGLLRRHGIDVVHSPMNVMPLLCSSASVVTINDLSFLLHPETHASQRNLYLKWGTALSARRCRALITFSESVRAEVVEHYRVPRKKVAVIPLAPTLAPCAAAVPPRRPYFLCVGTLEPRKNLPAVLEAFASIKDRLVHDLVLVGAKGWKLEGLAESAGRLGLGERTVFTGYVGDAELSGLYAQAEALVYPSLYEGFGLPPLEAMARGCPAIVSTARSLSELAGDAALRVDPHDVGGLAAAMLRVAQDRTLRAELVRKSTERAASFTWRRTAEQTLAVYEAVRGTGPIAA